jgi:cytochrome c oxidase cbb3-type subunit III
MSENKIPHKNEIDKVSGVETTGHEWDGLKELNNPLPRWWLWVFLITIIWSVGYWVYFPAWPTPGGATVGTAGWTSKTKLAQDQAEIAARQQIYLDRFEKASFEDIMKDDELYAFANAGGAAAFKDNCATCHGTGGAGAKGYPNLNDDDWLWGGKIEDIYQTIQYGIRSKHEDTRTGNMLAFGKDGTLKTEEINHAVEYVLSLSEEHSEGKDHAAGAEIFAKNCASCHGEDAKGLKESGAPNLTDKIWLYGGDHETIFQSVYNGRAGVMPDWKNRLDENTIRQLAVYVHQLGGGVKADTPATEPAPTEQQDHEPKPTAE